MGIGFLGASASDDSAQLFPAMLGREA